MKMGRSDLVLVVLGITGLATFLLFYERVFPQAAVGLEVDRTEAVETAAGFARREGAELDTYRRAVVFGGDSTALTFLQRTLGVQEASRWAREEVPVWTWNLRWFVPEQKEEWAAEVGVDGRIVGFRHFVEEAAEGADLEEAAAQRIAEAFLGRLDWDLDDLELVEASTSKRDNRTDHRFTWERRGTTIDWREDDPEAGTGAVRLAVTVQGESVGGYSHYLKVPEEFERELSGTLQTGTFLALLAVVFTVVLAIAALVVAIIRHRDDDIRWRQAIAAGGLMSLLMVVYLAASWPQLVFSYQTEFPWAVFVGIGVVGLVAGGAFQGGLVLITAAAGESLARERFRDSLRGWVEAARGRLRTLDFARASLRGYPLGFAFIGYLVVFYLFAQRWLGAWLPAEGPSAQTFNTYLPWLLPAVISLMAAVSEEVQYRLLGISLVKRWLGSVPGATAVALVVPAAIWAFAHSTYPVFPVWIRGVELTIGGVLFGLAFLHYGLLACIVAHYVVDAFLLSGPLLTSGNTGYVISGVVAILLALIPAGLALLARDDDTGLTGPSGDEPSEA